MLTGLWANRGFAPALPLRCVTGTSWNKRMCGAHLPRRAVPGSVVRFGREGDRPTRRFAPPSPNPSDLGRAASKEWANDEATLGDNATGGKSA
jgi:hypothetical protein